MMSRYPSITVDINKLRDNVIKLKELMHKKNIGYCFVTKGICAQTEIIKELDDIGIDYFCDSRIENLKKLREFKTKKIYLRISQPSEINDVVKYSDISFQSSLHTIKLIDKIKQHCIILMYDLGDLREGYIDKFKLFSDIEEIIKLKNIKIVGLGSNLTCYGGVIPTEKNINQLIEIKNEIEIKFNLQIDILTACASNSMYLIENGKMPKKMNLIRLGETSLLGTEATFLKRVKGLNYDVFSLKAQIVEINEKPSIPIGDTGYGAFRTKPKFKDRGIRKRAVLAIGIQDTEPRSLIPIDEDIDILGASSDHLIIDITDSKKEYEVGDIIEFNLEYTALLRAFTSEYVYKEIIKHNGNKK